MNSPQNRKFPNYNFTFLIIHEPCPDLVEELVVVLALGPLVLARDLRHDVGGSGAGGKVRHSPTVLVPAIVEGILQFSALLKTTIL